MDSLQLIVLALIQGITEFLPISSSAHLLFPKLLLGWQDQGLAVDVALHLGTLLAVVLYLRRDLLQMLLGTLRWVRTRHVDDGARSSGLVLIATLPLLPAGLFVAPHIDALRSTAVVAATTIGYALLLWYADRRSVTTPRRAHLDARSALLIGLAQVLALVPGTSRSGITMTAALLLGLDRVAAARFSFLLAIPAIAASALHQLVELLRSPEPAPWLLLAAAAGLAALVALAAMHALIAWLQRYGMLPFVLYRLVLGAALLVMTAL